MMKLWRYIEGNRKGKDANRLEREAMKDPFLAHAMRGYDRVKGNHTQQLERLQHDVTRRAARAPRRLWAAGIAASLLLVVGLGTYLLLQKDPLVQEMQMSLVEVSEPDVPVAPVPVSPAPPAPQEIAQLPVVTAQDEAAPLVAKQQTTPALKRKIVVEHIPEAEELQEHPAMAKVAEVAADAAEMKLQKVRTGEPIKPVTVQGRVTDAQGTPLPGVNVLVDGGTEGTITNLDGEFAVITTDTGRIKVSYIGFDPIVIPVDTSEVMHIAMHESGEMLDEVVVVGYGSQKKQVMTGAVTEVSAEREKTSTKSVEPQPRIGSKAYKKYLKKNLVRPTSVECAKAKGKVILHFYVNELGRPYNITVEKSLCPEADNEAIRLLKEGPDWVPGDVPTTLEVKF